MGIDVEVPGLNTIVPSVDDGSLLVVEGGNDAAKSFFVRRLVLTAGKSGRRVTFVTSREAEEVAGQLQKEGGPETRGTDWIDIKELDRLKSIESFGSPTGLLAVDSFSFVALPLSPEALAMQLRKLRQIFRTAGAPVILSTERGMLDSRSEAVTAHLADGLIQFHAQEGMEGVVRFLRIPKWTDGRFVDRNVYYDFDGERIAVDLRRRVL